MSVVVMEIPPLLVVPFIYPFAPGEHKRKEKLKFPYNSPIQPAAKLRVTEVIPIIDAIVVEGPAQAAKGLARAPFVRYVEPDPPDAVWTQEDTLVYGVDNINAEVVWGGAENATNVIPGHGGAGV